MSDRVKKRIGLDAAAGTESNRKELISYINLKLSTLDLPIYEKAETKELDVAIDLINNIRERNRILHDYLCPADKRIQDFLNRYLEDVCPEGVASLPNNTLVLDRYGLAGEAAALCLLSMLCVSVSWLGLLILLRRSLFRSE